MNKICKEYIKKVKILFPIMGKDEKNYINKLKLNLEDNFNHVTSLNELYMSVGTPEDTVNLYFVYADTDYIITRIRKSKFIKYCISVISLVLIITLLLFSIYAYEAHKTFKEEQVIYEETILE
ncbi:hypothetical protein B5E53_04470 [Eubacterium sp. An11]|uniref:DUF6120 family protein n=1 Tax=Eubacterium sp. An11 TaxID=1965542 RepID=UPI000B3AEB2F|nr:DUF6120 family protein [Eubacterium sp. An11]OUQ68786.1 hypothetical protein B5E53_04470 [Eubacterium sp. An11]